MAKMYRGWIAGNPWDKRKWRKLGVKGKMKFSFQKAYLKWGLGVFEHCLADKETFERMKQAGLKYPGAFSWGNVAGEPS